MLQCVKDILKFDLKKKKHVLNYSHQLQMRVGENIIYTIKSHAKNPTCE